MGAQIAISDTRADQSSYAALMSAVRRIEAVDAALGEHVSARPLAAIHAEANNAPVARVVVVGEFNSGKSTVINALVRANILPTGIIPTTATLNELVHSTKPGVQAIGSDGTITLLPYSEAALKEFTARYGDQAHISMLRIESPEIPADVVLYDTPGVNDINETRAELVYRLIPECDLALFVMDVQQALKQTEEEFIRHRLLGECLGHIIYVLNHCDRVSAADVALTGSRVRGRLAELYEEIAYGFHSKGATTLAHQVRVAAQQLTVVTVSAREELRGSGSAADGPHSFSRLRACLDEHLSTGRRRRLRYGRHLMQVSHSLMAVHGCLRDARALAASDDGPATDLAGRLRCEAEVLFQTLEHTQSVGEALKEEVTHGLDRAVQSIRVEATARLASSDGAALQAYVQGELQRTVEGLLQKSNNALAALCRDVAQGDAAASDLVGVIPDMQHTGRGGDDSLKELLNDPLNQMIALIAAPIVIFQLGWIGIVGLLAAPFIHGAWAQERGRQAQLEQLASALTQASRDTEARFANLITARCAQIGDHACAAVDRLQRVLRARMDGDSALDASRLDALEDELRSAGAELQTAYDLWCQEG